MPPKKTAVETAPRRHTCETCGGYGFTQRHEAVTGGVKDFAGGAVKDFDGGAVKDFAGGAVKDFDGGALFDAIRSGFDRLETRLKESDARARMQGRGMTEATAGTGAPVTAAAGTGVPPTVATSGTGKKKRPPTAWQKLVKKHLASGKTFKEAIAAAKAEYS
jgi:hypothetical protein